MDDFTEIKNKNKSDSTKLRQPITNTRMILMDFLPGVINPIARILQPIKQFTEFSNSVDIRKLERGGISILFIHLGQRNHASSILQDKWYDVWLPKQTWIDEKDKFKVAIFRFHTHLEIACLQQLPGILKDNFFFASKWV